MTARPETIPKRFPRWLALAPLLPAAVLTTCLILNLARHLYVAIPFPYELKCWSEGHLLYNALQLSRGENIYVDPSKKVCTAFAYGFVYPALMAPLVAVLGPKLWIGRAISILAATATLVIVFSLARRRSGYLAGCIAVILCLGTYQITCESWDWTHPDSLFIFLGFASLFCVDGKRACDLRWVAASAVLSTLCVQTKQTGAGFALGIAIFLVLRGHMRAILFAGITGVLLTATLLLAQGLTAGWYLRYVLGIPAGHPYEYTKLFRTVFTDMCNGLIRPLIITIPLFFVGAWQAAKQLRHSPGHDPLPLALACTLLPSLMALAKISGLSNNLSPVLLLLSVPTGTALSAMLINWRTEPAPALLASLGLLLQTTLAPRDFEQVIIVNDAARQIGDEIRAEIRQTPSRILLTHDISFAYLNGRDIDDTFALMREWDFPGGCMRWPRMIDNLRNQRFGKVFLPRAAATWILPDVAKALYENYDVQRVIGKGSDLGFLGPMYVLVPRSRNAPLRPADSLAQEADTPLFNR